MAGSAVPDGPGGDVGVDCPRPSSRARTTTTGSVTAVAISAARRVDESIARA
jgi:hypothetical protein